MGNNTIFVGVIWELDLLFSTNCYGCSLLVIVYCYHHVFCYCWCVVQSITISFCFVSWVCYWLLLLTMKRNFISSYNNDKQWLITMIVCKVWKPPRIPTNHPNVRLHPFFKSNSRTCLDSCDFLWVGTSHHQNDSNNNNLMFANISNNDIMIIMIYN